MKKKLLKTIYTMSFYTLMAIRLGFIPVLLATGMAWADGQTLSTVKIDLQTEDISLAETLNLIEQKTNFRFVYVGSSKNARQSVRVNAKRNSLYQVLKSLAKQAHVDFRRIGKNIYVQKSEVITKTPPPKITDEQESVSAFDKEITGKVIDAETGEPLIGATVLVKGTTIGAATDINGVFNFSIPEDAEMLICTYTGYYSQEIAITTQTEFNIQMKEDISSLNEIVVIGYGTQDKYKVSSAVGQVENEELGITKRPVSTIESSLFGTIPGLILNQSSGQLGQPIDIQVRTASALQSRGALILIDGFEGSIQNINPNDIASVSILKDAAATAIYGARSANGVVLITTKNAEKGQPLAVTLSSNFAWQRPIRSAEMVSSLEFMEFLNQAAINEATRNNPDLTPGDVSLEFSDDDLSRARSGFYPETNWVEELYSETAFQTSHNLGITGGSEKIGYYLNLGYLTQDGMIAGSDNLERINLRVKVDADINDWLTVGTNIMNTYRDLNSVPVNRGNSLRGRPFFPVQLADGTYVDKGSAGGEPNPVARAASGSYDRIETDALNLQAYAQIKPIKNLVLEGRVSYVNDNFNREVWNTPYEFVFLDLELNPDGDVIDIDGANRGLELSNGRAFSINTLTSAKYDFSLNSGHNFEAFVGFQTQKQQGFRGISAARSNFILPNLQDLDLGQALFGFSGFGNSSTRPGNRNTVSVFSRLSYDFQGKYLAEFSFRADASSYFPNDSWGFFPAISLGWNMHDENFLSNARFIDVLKLRASWGRNGDDTGVDQVLGTVITNSRGIAFGGQTAPTVLLGAAVNPDLTWETSEKLNFGLDFVLWNGKLSFSGDYFIDRRDDIITTLITPREVGLGEIDFEDPGNLGGILDNVYSAKAWGWEFQLGHRSEIGKVGINAGLNLSYYNSEITNSGGIDVLNPSNANYQIEGLPILGNWFGYETDGYFDTQDEIDSHVSGDGNPIDQSSVVSQGDDLGRYLGGLKFVDQNGDGVINDDDRKVLKENTGDNYRLGLNLEVTYAGFSLSARFYGVLSAYEWWNDGDFLNAFPSGVAPYRYQTDTWTTNNTSALFPQSTVTNIIPFETNTSHFIQKRNYIKLKNINLAYTFNENALQRLKWVKGLNLYLSLENLGVIWTDYPLKDYGWDPELGADEHSYPLPLKISFGSNITF